MKAIEVKIKYVSPHLPRLPLPTYESAAAAGMDLRADVLGEELLEPGQRKLIPTGIALELPEGFEAQIRPRSGLAIKHGVGMVNSPGTIDADYRGEIKVILINWGHETFSIRRGERIAQLIIQPVIRAQLNEVASLSDSDRGDGGFGSTGQH